MHLSLVVKRFFLLFGYKSYYWIIIVSSYELKSKFYQKSIKICTLNFLFVIALLVEIRFCTVWDFPQIFIYRIIIFVSCSSVKCLQIEEKIVWLANHIENFVFCRKIEVEMSFMNWNIVGFCELTWLFWQTSSFICI